MTEIENAFIKGSIDLLYQKLFKELKGTPTFESAFRQALLEMMENHTEGESVDKDVVEKIIDTICKRIKEGLKKGEN